MTHVLSLTVPINPLPTPRARSFGAQRFYSRAYSSYLDRLKGEAVVALRDRYGPNGWEPTPGMRFAVRALFARANSRRTDLDNLIKAFDAFTGVLWCDDSQIDRFHARKFVDRKNPRVQMSVYVVEVVTPSLLVTPRLA